MKSIDYKFERYDLSSRSSARILRESLLPRWSEGDVIRFDLSSVKSMSGSYADELFGVLSLVIGLKNFLASIRISKSSQCVELAIARAIALRNEKSDGQHKHKLS